MKKAIKVISVFMMILMMGIVLTGCNNDKDDKKEEKVDLSAAAGTYKGIYTKFVGDDTKVEDEEFSLELKDDGTGVSNTLSLNNVCSDSVTTPTCQKQVTSPQGEALGFSYTTN